MGRGEWQRMVRAAVSLAVAVGAASMRADTQEPARRDVGIVYARVSGTVFDSLSMRPLPGVTVQLVTRGDDPHARSSTTSASGTYAFDSVTAGVHLLGYFAPTLDPLGFEAPLTALDVREAADIRVPLATPSPRTMVLLACGSTPVADSLGLFYGTVRSARNGLPVAASRVRVEWSEFIIDGRRAMNRYPAIEGLTDASGNFALCGVPIATELTARASGTSDSSGTVPLTLPLPGVLRRDVFVGTAIALQSSVPGDVPSEDSATGILLARGTASVTGVVRRAEATPIGSARVSVVGSGVSATTGPDGAFRMEGLPAGSYTLDARAVGFLPERIQVDLLESSTPAVTVTLSAIAATLDTIRVRSSRVYTSAQRAGWEMRKRMGGGVLLDEAELAKRQPAIFVSDLFRGINGITLVTSPTAANGAVILMRSFGNALCAPALFLDGMLVRNASGHLDDIIGPSLIKGLEVYTRGASVPAQFQQMNGCGSIVIWTATR